VGPRELRQLRVQGRATKVGSIGARLGGTTECGAGVTCAEERCRKSRVGLCDQHNVGAIELTAAVANASDWSS
jgi:hypothetical protein